MSHELYIGIMHVPAIETHQIDSKPIDFKLHEVILAGSIEKLRVFSFFPLGLQSQSFPVPKKTSPSPRKFWKIQDRSDSSPELPGAKDRTGPDLGTLLRDMARFLVFG